MYSLVEKIIETENVITINQITKTRMWFYLLVLDLLKFFFLPRSSERDGEQFVQRRDYVTPSHCFEYQIYVRFVLKQTKRKMGWVENTSSSRTVNEH